MSIAECDFWKPENSLSVEVISETKYRYSDSFDEEDIDPNIVGRETSSKYGR